MFLLTLKGYFKLFIIFVQRIVSLQYKMLLVRLHVNRSIKLKAYKLFENSDADLSWLLFLKKLTCINVDNGIPRRYQEQAEFN